jgi:hypothetical protein
MLGSLCLFLPLGISDADGQRRSYLYPNLPTYADTTLNRNIIFMINNTPLVPVSHSLLAGLLGGLLPILQASLCVWLSTT